MKQSRGTEYALLILLAIIWSSSFLMIKVALLTVTPVTLAAGRMLLASIVLLTVLFLQGQRLPQSRRVWGQCVVVGLFSNALPFFLIAWGEQYINSGKAAIMMAIMPVLVPTLAHFFVAEERLTPCKFVGIALGFSGLLVLVGFEALAGLSQQVTGLLAVLLGTICYSTTAIFVRKFVKQSGIVMSSGSVLVGTILVVIAAFALEQPLQLRPSTQALAAISFLGVFATGLAAILYFRLLRSVGATIFSQINYLIPVLGVYWGALLLQERPGWNALVALLLIIGGVALVSRPQKDRRLSENRNRREGKSF